MRQPADAITVTEHSICEVLRTFWETHFASSPAVWAVSCVGRPRRQQELKVWVEFGPSKETHIPQTLLRNELHIAGFIIVGNPYDLTI
jgi:hypothetical protein